MLLKKFLNSYLIHQNCLKNSVTRSPFNFIDYVCSWRFFFLSKYFMFLFSLFPPRLEDLHMVGLFLPFWIFLGWLRKYYKSYEASEELKFLSNAVSISGYFTLVIAFIIGNPLPRNSRILKFDMQLFLLQSSTWKNTFQSILKEKAWPAAGVNISLISSWT